MDNGKNNNMEESANITNKITIYTIAEKTGVSISTVSRIINGQFRGKDTTKRKVLDIMEQLNYKPNQLARGLTGSKVKTNMIGVMAPFFTHPFFIEVLKGIYEALHTEEYHIILYDVDSKVMKKKTFDWILKEKPIDALLLVNMHLNKTEYESLTQEVPLILVAADTDFADSVSIDNYGGIEKGIEYIHSLGHKNVGFINNEKEIEESVVRERAFIEKTDEYGMGTKIDYRSVDRRSGYLSAKNMIENNPELTCLFYYSDLMAYGGLDYINENQLRNRICIIGFDGFEMTFQSRITTIVQPMKEMGAKAARLLIEKIKTGDEPVGKTLLETWLYKGETCGESGS